MKNLIFPYSFFQITPNNKVRGGFQKQPLLFMPVPTPRSRKRSGDGERLFNSRQSQANAANNVDLFATEVSARASNTPHDFVTPAKNQVIKSVLRKQGKENINDIVTPDMGSNRSFTAEEAGAIITQAQIPRHTLRTIQRAAKNSCGTKLFVNEKAIYATKDSQAKNLIDDCFESIDIQLQIKRQGQEKYCLENRPLVYVKDIKNHIETMIRNENQEQEFPTLEDGRTQKAVVGLTADAGGGSMKFSICLMHNKEDVPAKDHLIMVYEAADTMENTIKCFSRGLSRDMNNLNDSTILVDNQQYFIHFQGVFDLKAQDELLGAQGSCSVSPCTKCKVSLKHLQNHGGREHSKENCPEVGEKKTFKFFEDAFEKVFRMSHKETLDKLEKGNTSTKITTLGAIRKNGNKAGSVISLNLLPFTGVTDIADPLLHIYMGLCNNNLDAMKRDCRKLDKTVAKDNINAMEKVCAQFESKVQEMQNKHDQHINSKEQIQKISSARLRYIANKNELEAEKKADKLYKNKMKNKIMPFEDRQVCKSKYCLLFPIDSRFQNDMKLECSLCKKEMHFLCEGLTENSLAIERHRETYECHNCCNLSVEDIAKKFAKEIKSLDDSKNEYFYHTNNFICKLNQQRCELDLVRGPTEKKMEESFKKLNISPMSYHGGALNGKDCEKIMINAQNCSNFEEFEITKCLIDEMPETAEKYWTLFKILGDCWSKLSTPPKDENDLLDKIQACEEWSKKLPVLFPDRNITRKGHILSIHVPEYLQENPTLYHKFFKLEQRGEAVHAKYNKLTRERFFSIKPERKRVTKTIVELERLNNIGKKLFKPREYNKNQI